MGIEYLLGIISIVIAATIPGILLHLSNTVFGTLIIDNSDPEKDQYRIEIDDLEVVYKRRYVRLKVKRIDDQSQN